MSTKKQEQSELNGPDLEQTQKVAVFPKDLNKLYLSLLEDTPLLKEEDKRLYRQIFDAVVADLKPQSFLEWIDAKDYADKIFEERRYKKAITELIDGARISRKMFGFGQSDSEHDAILKYLPGLQKFTRMIDNSAASRRSIQKAFRRKAEANREIAAPPSELERKKVT